MVDSSTHTSESESELRFKRLINNSPICIHEIDLSGHIVSMNKAGLVMLGIADENQIIGQHFCGLVHKNELEKVLALFDKACAGENSQFQFQSINGKIFESSFIPIRDNQGNISLVMGQTEDITQLVNARNQIHEIAETNALLLRAVEKANKELNQIIEALDQSSLISITDINGTILKVNKKFCEISGYEANELLGKSHQLINSGYHSKAFWSEFWNTIKAGFVWRGEIKNRSKNGQEYWVETVINPIKDEEGKVINFLAIRNDITARKRSEEQLHETILRLSQIEQFANSTTDSIVVADESGRLAYINHAATTRLSINQSDCRNYLIYDIEEYFITEQDWKSHLSRLKQSEIIQADSIHINKQTGVRYPVETIIRYVSINDRGYIIAVSRDITERRKNEVALRESEARLAEAQRIAKLGYWELDLKTNTFWLSDIQYEISGLTDSKSLITQSEFLNVLHPEDRIQFLKNTHEAIQTGEDVSLTYRIIRPDGEVRVIQGSAHLTKDNRGHHVKLSGVNQDITERVLSEKALKESEQTLKRAQDVAKIGSWKLDVKSGRMEWSDETCHIFEVPTGIPLTYESFLTYVHPEDRDYLNDAWNAALRGSPYDIVHRILIGNRVKWVRQCAELVFDEFHNLIYGFGTIQDITDQKSLKDTNLIFEQAQLLTGLGSWRWSLINNELYWSENIYKLHGIPKTHVTLRMLDYYNSILLEDRKHFEEIIEETLTAKGTFETEYRVLIEDKIHWIFTQGKLLKDQYDNPIEMYGIVRDVTQEKQSKEEIIQARKAAEQANATKDEFLSIMSHEIRTPLNSVIGLSNLLLKRSTDAGQQKILKTLKGSADNLLHLVNDILDFSKIRAGKLELENLHFSLSTFLQHLHSSFYISAHEKGLDFNIQIDPRIPDKVVGDVTRLNQIFNNLLNNAIKFTHKGSVNLVVTLQELKDCSCKINFIVQDTGVGISTDKQKNLFQPFQQSDNYISREYGGTGLGLTIVKSLVDLLNGTISLESELGEGARFTIVLDFEISTSDAEFNLPPPSIEKRIVPEQSIRKKQIQVLYVEDVESNRFLIENVLLDYKIKCTAVPSGKAALRHTDKKKFDVILMDLQMPQMDGYQATKKIRKQVNGKNKNTPIVAFTAEQYSDTLKQKTQAGGIQDVITKPFNTELLIDKISVYSQSKKRIVNKKETILQERDEKQFCTFTFYERAFENNLARLKEVHKSVIDEFNSFCRHISKYNKSKNLDGLRDEVHKMRPIVKNLECQSLYEFLLQKHWSVDKFSGKVEEANKRVLSDSKQIIATLKKLKFS